MKRLRLLLPPALLLVGMGCRDRSDPAPPNQVALDPPPPRPVAASAPVGYVIGRYEQWTDGTGGGGHAAALTHRVDTTGPMRTVDTMDVVFGIKYVSTGVLFVPVHLTRVDSVRVGDGDWAHWRFVIHGRRGGLTHFDATTARSVRLPRYSDASRPQVIDSVLYYWGHGDPPFAMRHDFRADRTDSLALPFRDVETDDPSEFGRPTGEGGWIRYEIAGHYGSVHHPVYWVPPDFTRVSAHPRARGDPLGDDPTRLIGMHDPPLPSDVTPVGEWTIGSRGAVSYGITHLRHRSGDVLALDRIAGWSPPGKPLSEIVDVLVLPPLRDDEVLMSTCGIGGNRDENIVVVAVYDDAEVFHRIRLAWLADLTEARFRTIPVAGISCDNESYGIGTIWAEDDSVLACAPKTLYRGDTLSLIMSTPHPSEMVIEAPNGRRAFVHAEADAPADFRNVAALRVPTDREFSGDGRIFTRTGTYRVLLSDNFESDAMYTVYTCTLTYRDQPGP